MGLQRIALALAIWASIGGYARANPQTTERMCEPQTILQLVNIIGSDDRHPLSEVAGTLGFSAAEVKQAMSCTGDVVCYAGVGSAVVVRKSNILITARHIFVDEHGRRKRGTDDCYFSSFSNPTKKVPLLMSEAKELNSGENPDTDSQFDYAVFHLATPIVDCNPYPIEKSNEPIRREQQFIGLSGENFHSHPRPIPNEPSAQTCTVKRTYPRDYESGSSTFISDCDSEPGVSGGVNLQRTDGLLTAKGLFRGGGRIELNGQPFDETIQSETESIALDGDFLRLVLSY
jgi:hypothetical protein